MALFGVSKPLQNEGTGDETAKTKIAFRGEILEGYMPRLFLEDTITTKMIGSGVKGEVFPVFGMYATSDVQSHVAGAEYTRSEVTTGERQIVVERPRYISDAVDSEHQRIAQWDLIEPLAKRMGIALGKDKEARIVSEILIAGDAQGIGEQDDGQEIYDDDIVDGATDAIKGMAFVNLVQTAKSMLADNDMNSAEMEDVTFLTGNKGRDILLRSGMLVDTRYNVMSNGGIDIGNVDRVSGFDINISTQAGFPTYKSGALGNGTTINLETQAGAADKQLQGLVYTSDCVGILKAGDVATNLWYSDDTDSTRFSAKYVAGYGTLNPGGVMVLCGGAPVV